MNNTTNPILKQMETIAKPKDKRKFPFLTIVPSSNVDLIKQTTMEYMSYITTSPQLRVCSLEFF